MFKEGSNNVIKQHASKETGGEAKEGGSVGLCSPYSVRHKHVLTYSTQRQKVGYAGKFAAKDQTTTMLVCGVQCVRGAFKFNKNHNNHNYRFFKKTPVYVLHKSPSQAHRQLDRRTYFSTLTLDPLALLLAERVNTILPSPLLAAV